MNLRYMLLLALLPVCKVYGQMETGLNKDSLKKRLAIMRVGPDKVQTLIRLGQQLEAGQPDSALHYYAEAGRLSEQLHYPEGALRYIANYTAVLNLKGKFDESLQLNLKAIHIAADAKLPKQLMKAYCNTGAVYQNIEHYQQAITYYLKALPLVDSLGTNQEHSFIYGNLCGLYRNLQQPRKALPYGQMALTYAEKKQDDFSIAMACINLGNTLKDLGNIGKGISYLSRARDIGTKLKDDNIQETALIGLGVAYLTLKAPTHYLPALQQALPLALRLGDVSGKCFAEQGLATGLFYQKRFDQAATLLDSSIRYARLHDQKEPLSRMLLLMSDVQIALGRLPTAERYRAQYDSVSNKLLNAPLLKNIQELEIRYGVEKQQRRLLQKDLELARKQRWLISTLAIAVLFMLVTAFIYRNYRQRQRLTQKTIEALQAEQETLRLKAILEGEQQERRRISQEMHDDMGSGLTRLLFLTRMLDNSQKTSAKIQAAAAELIRKMNEVIWMMNNERDTLESLIAYLRATAADMLDGTGIECSFMADENQPGLILAQNLRRNIYLAVKEAVHNAIKHSGATTLTIRILVNTEIVITIEDNGGGFQHPDRQATGNGLTNMRSRLRSIGGSMEIKQDSGTAIIFTAPLS